MRSYHSKHTAALSTRGYYTILIVCGIIIAVSAWVLWTNGAGRTNTQPQTTTPIVSPVELTPDLSADTPVMAEPEPETEPEPSAEESAPTAAPQPETAVVSAPVYVRPTSGAVLTPFSGDELLFQPTMGDWRVHTGADLAAEAGETVLALTDGTVQRIQTGGLYGTSVTLSHDADLTTVYCGLDDVRVVEGQLVTAGEALGTCAEQIDAEATLGPHIHLEAARAGTPIDVLELLGEGTEE